MTATVYKTLLPMVLAAMIESMTPFPSVEMNRCFSILTVAALWWILEPFPSYVTSLLIVPAVVLGAVIPGSEPEATAITTVSRFFDPTMFMFVSGFSVAAALDKYRVTQKISAPFVNLIIEFSRAKSGADFGFYVSLSTLCVLVCAVVSNVAGAVLMTAIGQQISKQLELDMGAQRRLVLTIAFACNVGGMIVPIASPQNLVAILALRTASKNGLNVSFMDWVLFSVPFCVFSLLVVYVVLRARFGTGGRFGYSLVGSSRRSDLERHPGTPENASGWNTKQIACLSIVSLTLIGWCGFEAFGLQNFFGHMGIFGLFMVALMHGSGLLTAGDWQALPWPVLALLGGGLTLGAAVDKSGLLEYISTEVLAATTGLGPWVIAVMFFTSIAIVSNFLSSTVCAVIFLPVIATIGLHAGHPKLFVIPSALMVSGAMGLPVSSFPNANAASVSDAIRDKASGPILATSDFVRTGFAVGAVLLIMLSTGVYWMGMLVGF